MHQRLFFFWGGGDVRKKLEGATHGTVFVHLFFSEAPNFRIFIPFLTRKPILRKTKSATGWAIIPWSRYPKKQKVRKKKKNSDDLGLTSAVAIQKIISPKGVHRKPFLMQSDSASRKRPFSTGLFSRLDSSGPSSYRQSS